MFLKGNCRKCGETIKMDIGDMTRDEAIAALKEWKMFSCPGHHVEICPPYPHFWNLDEWELIEGHCMTEDEFLSDLKTKYKDVRDTEGMAGLIDGFSYGFPMTNDGKCWDFCQSPKGKRWYYTND